MTTHGKGSLNFFLLCLQHKFIKYSIIVFILTETESNTRSKESVRKGGCGGVND